jgi:hypothetical protein
VNTNLPSFEFTPPVPSRHGEVTWLEPYPDLLLEDLPDTAPGPQARYEAREAISLAHARLRPMKVRVRSSR